MASAGRLMRSFAYAVAEVKWLYSLSVDTAEYEALEEMIDTCTPMMWNPQTGGSTNNIQRLLLRRTRHFQKPHQPTTPHRRPTPCRQPPPLQKQRWSTIKSDFQEPRRFSQLRRGKSWFDTYFPLYGDVARLDGDNDSEPCESLRGP